LRPRTRIKFHPIDRLGVGSRGRAGAGHLLRFRGETALGLDPDQLGSPWGAAIGSLLSFTAGAFVPLAPNLVAGGSTSTLGAVALSLLALGAVGAGVSLATGRRVIRCALRQVATGAAAATVTFQVGTVIGV
jgi:VIT1/CCC1 family predicted Fe2+/Mn2+ transporter